jgi:hypothetical protein
LLDHRYSSGNNCEDKARQRMQRFRRLKQLFEIGDTVCIKYKNYRDKQLNDIKIKRGEVVQITDNFITIKGGKHNWRTSINYSQMHITNNKLNLGMCMVKIIKRRCSDG